MKKPYRGNLLRDSASVNAWLAQKPSEEALEPELPIIDAHHHLLDWRSKGIRYLFEDLLVDIGRGHNICSTVFLEAANMYRNTGPVSMRPVGEVEFAVGAAAMSAS